MSYKSGFAAIIGCPNVGKSTLLNKIIGSKVAIVSPRAQTTRNKITGILTLKDCQIIFLDTPGIHKPNNKLGSYMMRETNSASKDVDVNIFVADPTVGVLERDEETIKTVMGRAPFIAVINKIDISNNECIHATEQRLKHLGVQNIYKISAATGEGIDELLKHILSYLPEGPQYYPEDMITDRPERFIAAEIIREKLLTNLRDEIPHGTGVEIEKIDEYEDITDVYAAIYCEREGHKGIIIGKNGKMLKKIGSEARVDLEIMFGTKVFLKLFVKVREDWRNSAGVLKTLGYMD